MMYNDCPSCRHLKYYEAEPSAPVCSVYTDNEGPDDHCYLFEAKTQEDIERDIQAFKNSYRHANTP